MTSVHQTPALKRDLHNGQELDCFPSQKSTTASCRTQHGGNGPAARTAPMRRGEGTQPRLAGRSDRHITESLPQ